MRMIPAIDLRAGRTVRLLRGDFDAETRYDAEPVDLLRRYAKHGADWLHVVDLDGARDGAGANHEIIGTLSQLHALELQVGGGLRDAAALDRMFALGISRAVVGSAALSHPHLVRAWLGEFGAERLALAFDVRIDAGGTPRVAIHGWREQSTLSLWAAVEGFLDCGLAHVLCTDVSRDGALTGPNVDLYTQAVSRFPSIAWQASGGVRDVRDLHALAAAGCAAAVSGKALLDGLIRLEELQPFLPNA